MLITKDLHLIVTYVPLVEYNNFMHNFAAAATADFLQNDRHTHPSLIHYILATPLDPSEEVAYGCPRRVITKCCLATLSR